MKCYLQSQLTPPAGYNQTSYMAILYALLHHSGYRHVAKNFLRKHLPTIPPIHAEHCRKLEKIGKKLIHTHLFYECEKPHLYQKTSPLKNAPAAAFAYEIGGGPMIIKQRENPLLPRLITTALKTMQYIQEISTIPINLSAIKKNPANVHQ